MLPNDKLKTEGIWTGKIYRADGTLRDEFEVKNLVPDEGINDLLDVLYNGKAQNSFFCGLKADAGIPASNWSYGDIDSLFTEFVGYDETLRQTWTTGAASGKTVSNSSTMNFTVTANSSVVTGAMLVTNATKSDSTVAAGNVLTSILNFGSAKNLDAAEVLSLTYSFSASSA